MSDNINWNGTLPPPSPPTPVPPRASPLRYLWAIALLLVAGIALYPWLRPMLTSDSCHPGGQSTVLHVPLSVCVDPQQWSSIITFEPGKTSFGAGNDKVYFDTFGSRIVVPLTEFPSLILRYGRQFATNSEELEVVKEWTTDIGGRTWRVLEYASETADFVDYYYSADGFGSAQLLFTAFKPDVAKRDSLVLPILSSVAFLPPPKT